MNLLTLFGFLFGLFLYHMKKYNFYFSIIYIHDVYQLYFGLYSYMLIAVCREGHRKNSCYANKTHPQNITSLIMVNIILSSLSIKQLFHEIPMHRWDAPLNSLLYLLVSDYCHDPKLYCSSYHHCIQQNSSIFFA